MTDTGIWQIRQILHPREPERALDYAMEIARHKIAAQLLKVMEPGRYYTVRYEVGAKPYYRPFGLDGASHLPGREVVGELEVQPVHIEHWPVRMVAFDGAPSLSVARSAVQELRHRARRAVSRAVGRLAFWRKERAK